MGILNHAKILGLVALFCSALMTAPAYAQMDLSGTWNPQYLEDLDERIPGPELVDYLGIPINAAARQWALSWDPECSSTHRFRKKAKRDAEPVLLPHDQIEALHSHARYAFFSQDRERLRLVDYPL